MQMNLKELIDALARLQTIAGDGASTSVNSVSLKVETGEKYNSYDHYNYSGDRPRCTYLTVWVDSFKDEPTPGPVETFPEFTKSTAV